MENMLFVTDNFTKSVEKLDINWIKYHNDL